jgi:hypothetical protein
VGPCLSRSVRGFHGVLIDYREFSTLRQVMLEKVLRVGGVRSCPYLVAKPSRVGVNVDGISCPLHHPITYGCRPDASSLWFGNVLPCLVAKPFFGGVAALMGPHAVSVRLGPKAIGPMLPGLITSCGMVLSLQYPYLVA